MSVPWCALHLCLQILNPFYVFQAFTLTLWLSQGYIEYSVAIIILSIISVGLTVYSLRQVSLLRSLPAPHPALCWQFHLSVTDASSYLYALSGYFLLLCILLYYYRFIAIEELKGSYLGVLNFPRIKEGWSLIPEVYETLWRWTVSMSLVATVISGGFTPLKVC